LTLTEIFVVLVAIGLCIPMLRVWVGLLLVLYLIPVFPANVWYVSRWCCGSGAKLAERNDVRAQGMREEKSVDIQALFGLSVLMSFVAFGFGYWSETTRWLHCWCRTRFGSLVSASSCLGLSLPRYQRPSLLSPPTAI